MGRVRGDDGGDNEDEDHTAQHPGKTTKTASAKERARTRIPKAQRVTPVQLPGRPPQVVIWVELHLLLYLRAHPLLPHPYQHPWQLLLSPPPATIQKAQC